MDISVVLFASSALDLLYWMFLWGTCLAVCSQVLSEDCVGQWLLSWVTHQMPLSFPHSPGWAGSSVGHLVSWLTRLLGM